MALLLEQIPDDAESLKALLLAVHADNALLTTNVTQLTAERDQLQHKQSILAAELNRVTAQNERLSHILAVLRRAHYGRSSERISDDQMQLALEDVEVGCATEDAKAEQQHAVIKRSAAEKRRANRGHLPAHLPREEVVIEPDSKICPCCGEALHVIGEDVSERLDRIPAKLRVIVTRRPKYACRACTNGVVQAPAPLRLIEGGLPTEAFVADVLVSKYADHCPLYRQSQILAREGVNINRSTFAHWVGFAAVELEPLHAYLLKELKSSPKLFADETRCPVLDPGRGKTKTGYLWAYARDDRPWASADPPGVAYMYAPGRGAEHAERHLAGFSGVLQVDGYAAYRTLAEEKRPGGSLTLALCWSHFRRRFYDIAKSGNAPIATEALARIGKLYEVEADIRGRTAAERRDVRQVQTKPLTDKLKVWLEQQVNCVSGRSSIAEAIRYGLNHWKGLTRFLEDGRIEIDTNTVERSIRPLALTRKNSLFCGSDEGGENWAIIGSLIETAKLNAVNPYSWLSDTLTRLVNRWPANRIAELMPWAYDKKVVKV